MVRNHAFLRLAGRDNDASADVPSEAVGKPVIVRSKTEYHSTDHTQGELTTDEELARWWLTSLLCPDGCIWVSLWNPDQLTSLTGSYCDIAVEQGICHIQPLRFSQRNQPMHILLQMQARA